MRNAKFSKVLAATMAATMLLTPATVFAAEGDGSDTTPTTPAAGGDVTDPTKASSSIGGDGSLEGYVKKDVFCVVLPTISNVNFTLDPQGLLNKADSTKYTKTDAGVVYFTNAPTTESGNPTYTDKSDAITFINKSSYDVEVGLAVTLDTGDIDLVAKDALATATTPSLYLGLIKDTGAAVAINSDTYESDAATVAKVPEVDGTTVTKGYQIKGSTTEIEGVTQSPNGYYYSYALTDGFANTDAKKVEYKLEGACDSKADWSAIDTKAVTATVAWTITKAGEPNISGSAFSRSNTTNTYTLKNIDQEIKSISISADGKTPALAVPASAYSVNSEKTTLTINGSTAGIGAAAVGQVRYFIVTFADNSTIAFAVNVSA